MMALLAKEPFDGADWIFLRPTFLGWRDRNPEAVVLVQK
jgi:hypothetical protein